MKLARILKQMEPLEIKRMETPASKGAQALVKVKDEAVDKHHQKLGIKCDLITEVNNCLSRLTTQTISRQRY